MSTLLEHKTELREALDALAVASGAYAIFRDETAEIILNVACRRLATAREGLAVKESKVLHG